MIKCCCLKKKERNFFLFFGSSSPPRILCQVDFYDDDFNDDLATTRRV